MAISDSTLQALDEKNISCIVMGTVPRNECLGGSNKT